MDDVLIVVEPVVTLIESAGGDVVVTTTTETSVLVVAGTDVLLSTTQSTDVLEVVTTETILAQQEAITILTEGVQGPPGASGLGAAQVILEAGEDLALSDPAYVSANKLHKASHLNSNGVIGLITTAALTGFVATATTMGVVGATGLTAGLTYFLGDGVLTPTAPISGNVVRMGKAVSTTSIVLNIEEPVLLST